MAFLPRLRGRQGSAGSRHCQASAGPARSAPARPCPRPGRPRPGHRRPHWCPASASRLTGGDCHYIRSPSHVFEERRLRPGVHPPSPPMTSERLVPAGHIQPPRSKQPTWRQGQWPVGRGRRFPEGQPRSTPIGIPPLAVDLAKMDWGFPFPIYTYVALSFHFVRCRDHSHHAMFKTRLRPALLHRFLPAPPPPLQG